MEQVIHNSSIFLTFVIILCLNLGDVNGDGFNEIIIGALRVYDSYSGAAYVVYGGSSLGSVAMKTLGNNSHLGFLIASGLPYSWFGYSVSEAGL